MQPNAPPAPAPPVPGRLLIVLGAVGCGLLTLGAVAPIVIPGLGALSFTGVGEILLILGCFGMMQRAGSGLWLLAAIGTGLNFLGTLVAFARSLIGFGLLANFGWFFAALAWGLLGLTFLVRRNDGHPGVGSGAGILALLRALVSFGLALVPFLGFFGFDPVLGTRGWQLTAFLSSALAGLFFVTAIGKPAARPAAPGWQPPPGGWQPPPGGWQPPPGGRQPPPGGWQPPAGGAGT